MRMRRAAAAGLAIAVASAGGELASGNPTPNEFRGGTPKVKVGDDFFSKRKLNLNKGQRIKFKWKSSNRNPHQIVLRKGPDGVDKRDFRSRLGQSGITFKPKFRKPGEYKLICIIHPEEMTLKANVRQR